MKHYILLSIMSLIVSLAYSMEEQELRVTFAEPESETPAQQLLDECEDQVLFIAQKLVAIAPKVKHLSNTSDWREKEYILGDHICMMEKLLDIVEEGLTTLEAIDEISADTMPLPLDQQISCLKALDLQARLLHHTLLRKKRQRELDKPIFTYGAHLIELEKY